MLSWEVTVSMSVSSSVAPSLGYKLSLPAGLAAVQSVRAAETAAMQSLSLASADAIKSVTSAADPSHFSYASSAGAQRQIYVPTDLTPLVKGG